MAWAQSLTPGRRDGSKGPTEGESKGPGAEGARWAGGPAPCWSLIISPAGPEPSASQLPCLLKRRLISFDSQAGLQMRGDFSGSPVARTLPSNAAGVHWSGQGAKILRASQPKTNSIKT